MVLRDDVLVKILDHLGLPSLPSVLPVFKPARGPPIQPEEKLTARSQVPLHIDEDFFADPDYSEFDCMDEPPDVVQSDLGQVERKDSRPPRNLLELVDYFPGKKLCWASELLEDEENKTS